MRRTFMVGALFLGVLLFAPLAQADEGRITPVYRIDTTDKVAFITIDDGVHKPAAARAYIEKHQLPVTAFLTAWTVKDRADYFKRVTAWGSIQNHSATHASFAKSSTNLNHEICYTQRKLTRDFNRAPWMLRPPYGAGVTRAKVSRVAKRCGISELVMWDSIVERGKVAYREGRTLRPGSIILMHFTPDLAKDLQLAHRLIRKAGLKPANLDDYLPRPTRLVLNQRPKLPR